MKYLAFNEKSALAMIVALSLSGLVYFVPVLSALFGTGTIIPPGPIAIAFVIALIAFSTLIHIVVALSNPSEAGEMRDERNRANIHFAGHWSGIVLSAGVILSLLIYFPFQDGNILFHCVFMSLIVASLIEYILIIIAYRRAL